MRKQVGARVWEHRQALILTCTKDTLWALFNEKHPNLLAAKQYFGVLEKEVWNLKKAYRENACVVPALTVVCSVKVLLWWLNLSRFCCCLPQVKTQKLIIGT